jgi:hypothetical protein
MYISGIVPKILIVLVMAVLQLQWSAAAGWVMPHVTAETYTETAEAPAAEPGTATIAASGYDDCGRPAHDGCCHANCAALPSRIPSLTVPVRYPPLLGCRETSVASPTLEGPYRPPRHPPA